MCKSKVVGLTLTHKKIDYEGSIALPSEVLEKAKILPGEMVLVVNLANGKRFYTYTIKGEKGRCGLFGGAARTAEVGDKLLVLSFSLMEEKESLSSPLPIVVKIGPGNKLVE
jgi:aspartate 1-decarboxylase